MIIELENRVLNAVQAFTNMGGYHYPVFKFFLERFAVVFMIFFAILSVLNLAIGIQKSSSAGSVVATCLSIVALALGGFLLVRKIYRQEDEYLDGNQMPKRNQSVDSIVRIMLCAAVVVCFVVLPPAYFSVTMTLVFLLAWRYLSACTLQQEGSA